MATPARTQAHVVYAVIGKDHILGDRVAIGALLCEQGSVHPSSLVLAPHLPSWAPPDVIKALYDLRNGELDLLSEDMPPAGIEVDDLGFAAELVIARLLAER